MTRLEQLIHNAQHGDEGAKESLISENAPLVWSIARRYLGRGAELEDLFQLGCVGFLKAVEGFDFGYGTQFSTYAVPKISGEIRRFLRDDGMVKVSRTVKEQAVNIHNARQKLTGELGMEPTLSELASYTGLTVEEIAMTENATACTESIQQENGEDGFCLENMLTDTESEERMVEKMALRQAVSSLPEREKTVISLRYFHGLTQCKTAEILSISQVQVSRIEKKALASLKHSLA